MKLIVVMGLGRSSVNFSERISEMCISLVNNIKSEVCVSCNVTINPYKVKNYKIKNCL